MFGVRQTRIAPSSPSSLSIWDESYAKKLSNYWPPASHHPYPTRALPEATTSPLATAPRPFSSFWAAKHRRRKRPAGGGQEETRFHSGNSRSRRRLRPGTCKAAPWTWTAPSTPRLWRAPLPSPIVRSGDCNQERWWSWRRKVIDLRGLGIAGGRGMEPSRWPLGF